MEKSQLPKLTLSAGFVVQNLIYERIIDHNKFFCILKYYFEGLFNLKDSGKW